ncbi:MAG: metalloregulator ArsR/SmtB family transcription factor [Lachnospiraceae bacterium]|nr:metalloregulator ArsR/SmtB family transcription factor [Lachnospiraceae bacterium]
MDDSTVVEISKALSSLDRIGILRELTEGEMNATQLNERLNMVKSTLSHHLKILSGAELITVRKSGKWHYFSLNNGRIAQYLSFFENSIMKK